MTWARLDDGFYDHPKVRPLSLAARGLFCTGLSYAARYSTDGLLTAQFIKSAAHGRGGRAALRELEGAGLFKPGEDGTYLIHDYLDYNPARDQLQGTKARRDRMVALHRDKELVNAIRLRDADHCRYCNRHVDWKDRRGQLGATYDHVDPDGENSLDNVVVACRGCNSAKGDRTPAQAGMVLLQPYGAQVDFGRSVSDLDTNLPPRVGSGRGSTETSEEQPELHAPAQRTVVDDVLDILRRAERFTVDDILTRQGVENAICAVPDRDPLAAAHAAVVTVSDAAFRLTAPAKVFLMELRKQPEGMRPERLDSRPAYGGRRERTCPLNLCDGGGIVIDEESDSAHPCRCRLERVA